MWKVSANRDNSARRRHRRFHSQQRRRASSAVDLRRAKNVTLVNPLVERTAFNYVVGPLVMTFNRAFRQTNDVKYPMLLPLYSTMGLLCSRTADARLTSWGGA